jgi:type I restriction enzyme R subunit
MNCRAWRNARPPGRRNFSLRYHFYGLTTQEPPDAAPVNLLTDRAAQGRVYVSTYPTMLKLIEEIAESGRRFGPGHFDLIIVDEAHRSIYKRYGAIFRYFDSLLVGLTATPKDEIDRNTYSLFELQTDMPTDAYELEDAVKDGFLVPMRAVSFPLKFQRQGITYAELSDAEKEQWDEAEWESEDGPPDRIEAEAVNQWLFNQDTIDKVLQHLMTAGLKVEGGDRLGKTIIFAKNHNHAEFIQKRFDANYPHLKGHFALVIDNKVDQAQTLIDRRRNGIAPGYPDRSLVAGHHRPRTGTRPPQAARPGAPDRADEAPHPLHQLPG